MIEAGEREERLEPRLLHARELARARLRGATSSGVGVSGAFPGKPTTVCERESLDEDAVGDARVGVVGLEIDGGLEPVPECVDVGGVRVNVLPERVRVLEELAERGGIVGGGMAPAEAKSCPRPRVCSPGPGGRTDDECFEHGLGARGGLGDALTDHGVGCSSAYAMRRPLGAKEIARTRKPRASSC